MRLICGIVQRDGAPVTAAQIEAMLQAMLAPGLQARLSVQLAGAVGLGVLEVHPEPGMPPLTAASAEGRLLLAADAQLYRPRELARQLGLAMDSTDEDLLQAACAQWGERLPDRLDGDFALASWNARHGELLLARDAMGLRPLCWSERGSCFAFASLPAGLHAVTPLQPHALGLAQVLHYHFPRDEMTIYRDVYWLRAGHSLRLTARGVEIRRQWQPDVAQVGSWRGDDIEAAQELRRLISEAVAVRLPGDGAVASHLSGGLDSSSVAVLAARELARQGRPLPVFAQLADPAWQQPLSDEWPFVQAVLEQESNMQLHRSYIARLRPDDCLSAAVPGSAFASLANEQVCQRAAAGGARILLSGAGGDEGATYNALNIYPALLYQGEWRAALRELIARGRVEGRTLWQMGKWHVLGPLLRPLLPGRRSRAVASELALLQPELAAEVSALDVPGFGMYNRAQDRVDMLINSYISGRATSWALGATRYGVVLRYPLLDRAVLDFILSLPLRYFVADGMARQPFRRAMQGILPEKVRLRRRKYVPFPDSVLALDSERGLLLEHCRRLRQSPSLQQVFSFDHIEAALQAAPAGEQARRLALAANTDQHVDIGAQRMGLHAVRALVLAAHAQRLLHGQLPAQVA